MIENITSYKGPKYPIEQITVDLPSEYENLYLFPIADTHIGDPLTDEKALKKYIDNISKIENAIVALNGDLLDTGIADSVTGPYYQKYNTEEQVSHAAELLDPIKDKIVFISQGNHEARVSKKTSIDPSAYLAVRLGLENVYLKVGGVLKIRFGHNLTHSSQNRPRKTVYNIQLTHGAGGGATSGSKINKASKMELIVAGCDVNIMSHVHENISTAHKIFQVSTNSAPTEQIVSTITTGAWQQYGGYGHSGMFQPSAALQTYIIFDGLHKNIPRIVQNVDPNTNILNYTL